MAEAKHEGTDPKVPAERADRARSRDGGREGTDRPGFDLGGAADASVQRGAIPEEGPVGDPTLGDAHPTGKSRLTSDAGTPA